LIFRGIELTQVVRISQIQNAFLATAEDILAVSLRVTGIRYQQNPSRAQVHIVCIERCAVIWSEIIEQLESGRQLDKAIACLDDVNIVCGEAKSTVPRR
jgi:hypothetical protein